MIMDSIERNRAALDEAWRMYYGAEDIFDHLYYIAYEDEQAYYAGDSDRDLADATARLQQYTDQIAEIDWIIEDIEYEMTETFSNRQLGYLEYDLDYYEYIREEIEALEWNTQDLIDELNSAANEASDIFAEQDDEDYEYYFGLQEEYEAEFDWADSVYNDIMYRYYTSEDYDYEEELVEESVEHYYEYWI